MGFIIVMVIVGIVFYIAMQNTKRTREKWCLAASNLNLSFVEGGFGKVGSIQGVQNGHDVTVTTFSKSRGKSSQTYTQYTCVYSDVLPFDLKMTRQGALFAIKKVFGFEDVELGDHAFDSLVIVQSAQPAQVREFLTTERRDAVRLLVESYPSVVITSEYVEIDKTGLDADPGVIVNCVKQLTAFCDVMTEAGQMDDTAVVEPQPVYEINEDPSKNPAPDSPRSRVDERARNPLDSVNPQEPAVAALQDPEVATLETGAQEPVAEEPVADGDPAVSPAGITPLDIKAVAEDLYRNTGTSSLAVNAAFSERYENRPVIGKGELKRVSKFSYDAVFKNMKGVKAVCEIGQFDGPYSKIKVNAEIAYPEDRYQELNSREGASVEISGRLVAQDAMLTQLYIIAE